MMTVKKYDNRKLYFDGKYISLIDIITALKQGQQVEVISHSSGEDVTNKTLKEALVILEIDTETVIDLIKKA